MTCTCQFHVITTKVFCSDTSLGPRVGTVIQKRLVFLTKAVRSINEWSFKNKLGAVNGNRIKALWTCHAFLSKYSSRQELHLLDITAKVFIIKYDDFISE